MTDIVYHRGPDGEGHFLEENVGLGHRRLSIIDLDTGDQPMFDENKKIALVLNGEIYNYIELRDELRAMGYQFHTNSDTEVIIRAYQAWGVGCQEHFNGMWAFALWDSSKGQLFISRDRLGEKPLHYALWDNSFLFGSEIKSLFEYGIPREPRLELLEIYSVLKSIPAPHTFYKNIKKLMPGHCILVNGDGVKDYEYWNLPEINENNLNTNTKEVEEKFEYLLKDAVSIRMRSDVPFGAFLSGGLDSSAIVSLMSEISSHPVETFTIGYPEKEFDESDLAELVSKKFETEHHLKIVTSENFEEILRQTLFHYDEPFGDSSAIPTGYVSKFASERVKMVLTGDGGDEVLSGYSSYQGIRFAEKYQRLPRGLQTGLPMFLNQSARLFTGKYRYALNRYGNLLRSSSKPYDLRLLEKRAKPGASILKSLINPNIKSWPIEEFIIDAIKACPYHDDFYKQMYFNYKYDLPDDLLVKTDRMSMAHSLEARLPFLDYRLVEFMAGVDKTVKMQGWERKSVLRNTLAKQLPKKLMTAPKKGFRVPIREWFKQEHINNKLENSESMDALFNKAVLRKLIIDNKEGRQDHGNLLWSLLVLSEQYDH